MDEDKGAQDRQSVAQRPQRLYRSRTDRMMFGVAGGLAEYFDMDPTVVRLVYAVVTVLTGFFPGAVLYVALALIVPAGSEAGGSGMAGRGDRTALAAAILVAVGVLILLGNFGLFSFGSWVRWWPLLLILLGVALISRRRT